MRIQVTASIPKGISIFTLPLLLLLQACSHQPFWLPEAHKIEIQQGNLISQFQRDQLATGMSRQDVLSIIGSPVQETGFTPERWDYVYTRTPAGRTTDARVVSLYFENESVARIEDNRTEQDGEIPLKEPWWHKVLGRS